MDIENNLLEINKKIKNYNARLIPVVKNRTVEEVRKVYNFGFRELAENRLDDYFLHYKEFNDVEYHFIAPLQSRKIKILIANSIFIHTVSRYKEIDLISNLSNDYSYLIQINIDNDSKKSGIDSDSIFEYFEYCHKKNNIPKGLMCIPNIDSDPKIVFSRMQSVNESLKKEYKNYQGELSMGMSEDYEIALDYGATIIRIGTKIFT